MLFIKIVLLSSVFIISTVCKSQDKYDQLSDSLKTLAVKIPALDETVNISVTRVSIQEFLRGVANNSGLNIDVDPTLNIPVINNFIDVKVRDLLVYVCRQYNLDLKVIGNIFNIYKSPQNEAAKKPLTIQYDTTENRITLDYSNENLSFVVKDITKKTNNNIVLSPGLSDVKISGFIQDMPFDNALEKLMYENNLLVSKTEDNFYIVSQKPSPDQSKEISDKKRGQRGKTGKERTSDNAILDVRLIGKDTVSVFADGAQTLDIIYEVAQKTNAGYYISGKLDETASLNLKKGSFRDVLNYILNGTKFSYRQIDSLYYISDDKTGLVKESRLIKLKKRSINKLLETIPKTVREGLDIVEFPELNGFLVSGSTTSVDIFSSFLEQIDQPVPVILIEAIIADISDDITVTAGISAGIDKTKTPGISFNGTSSTSSNSSSTTSNSNSTSTSTSTSANTSTSTQSSLGGFSVTVGSDAINKALQANHLNSFGNLMPNVYLSLNALETRGLANIRSTPQLSTLNGHEATLSIGETTYYLEQQSSLMGAQSPIQNSYQSYKSLKAELSLSIKPYIANDDQITLEIELSQSSFSATRINGTGPPDLTNRTFKSQIRVQNQEMFLLGGLEEETHSTNSSGLPLLSRIPVLKWIFGTTTKTNNKSRLNIFIRPTIVN